MSPALIRSPQEDQPSDRELCAWEKERKERRGGKGTKEGWGSFLGTEICSQTSHLFLATLTYFSFFHVNYGMHTGAQSNSVRAGLPASGVHRHIPEKHAPIPTVRQGRNWGSKQWCCFLSERGEKDNLPEMMVKRVAESRAQWGAPAPGYLLFQYPFRDGN